MLEPSSGWPTPRSSDGEKNIRTPEGSAREMERKGGPQDLNQAATLTPSGWPTPQAHDTSGRSDGQKEKHGTQHGCSCLVQTAKTTELPHSGWPTPAANEYEQDPEKMRLRREHQKAMGRNGNGFGLTLGMLVTSAVGWPTPCAKDADSHRNATATRSPEAKRGEVGTTLTDAATYAGWATPTTVEKARSEEFRKGREPNAREALAGWRTPDHNQRGGDYQDPEKVLSRIEAGHQVNLNDQATLAGWPTPMAGTPAQNGNNEAGNTDSSRKTVALATHGDPSNGSPARTESRGQLNPEFSRWLMNYPPVWGQTAPCKRRRARACSGATATPSSQPSPPSS